MNKPIFTWLTVLLSSNFAIGSLQAMCGGDYTGRLEIARSLEHKALACQYNGVGSNGQVKVFIPRCVEGRASVLLEAFNQEISLTSIDSSDNHFLMNNRVTDSSIICEVLGGN